MHITTLWKILSKFRSVFLRERSFSWFKAMILGILVRQDALGPGTSILRGLRFAKSSYTSAMHFINHCPVSRYQLALRWTEIVLDWAKDQIYTINGRKTLIIDTINIAREGRMMPSEQTLYNSSQNTSKPEYVLGHCYQSVGVLAKIGGGPVCIPITANIHLGCKGLDDEEHEPLEGSKNAEASLLTKGARMLWRLFKGKGEEYHVVCDSYYGGEEASRNTRYSKGLI